MTRPAEEKTQSLADTDNSMTRVQEISHRIEACPKFADGIFYETAEAKATQQAPSTGDSGLRGRRAPALCDPPQ